MDINIELMASELRPEYAGPTSVRLQSGNGFDVTLVGTQEEIFDALSLIADQLEQAATVSYRDPGPSYTSEVTWTQWDALKAELGTF